MIDDIIKSALEAGNVEQPAVCEYCGKKFVKVSTLAAHRCEPRRREEQKNEIGPRLGLMAFVKFWKRAYPRQPQRTYAQFAASSYYKAFVKYGWYLHNIDAVGREEFTDWLLSNNKKLDKWCSDKFYEEFLLQYIRKERPIDAIERSLLNISNYTEKNNITLLGIFRHLPDNSVCYLISKGKISPWFVYASESGIEFLERVNQNMDHLTMIYEFIDPQFWGTKINRNYDDFDFCKQLLRNRGF